MTRDDQDHRYNFVFLLKMYIISIFEYRSILNGKDWFDSIKNVLFLTSAMSATPCINLFFFVILNHFHCNHFFMVTIQIFFLIWISRSFKKRASDNTISYFNQSFRFSGLWLILARDLGRSGQNKSWGTVG